MIILVRTVTTGIAASVHDGRIYMSKVRSNEEDYSVEFQTRSFYETVAISTWCGGGRSLVLYRRREDFELLDDDLWEVNFCPNGPSTLGIVRIRAASAVNDGNRGSLAVYAFTNSTAEQNQTCPVIYSCPVLSLPKMCSYMRLPLKSFTIVPSMHLLTLACSFRKDGEED